MRNIPAFGYYPDFIALVDLYDIWFIAISECFYPELLYLACKYLILLDSGIAFRSAACQQ